MTYWPRRICMDCGNKCGRPDKTAIITVSPGVCDWCRQTKDTAAPSDYGYPPPPPRSKVDIIHAIDDGVMSDEDLATASGAHQAYVRITRNRSKQLAARNLKRRKDG